MTLNEATQTAYTPLIWDATLPRAIGVTAVHYQTNVPTNDQIQQSPWLNLLTDFVRPRGRRCVWSNIFSYHHIQGRPLSCSLNISYLPVHKHGIHATVPLKKDIMEIASSSFPAETNLQVLTLRSMSQSLIFWAAVLGILSFFMLEASHKENYHAL